MSNQHQHQHQSTSPSTPSVSAFQADYNSRWDQCISNGLVNAGSGLVVAGFLGLIFARNLTVRSSIAALGAGFGAGQSWVECRQQFLAANTRNSSTRFTIPRSSSTSASPAQLLSSSEGSCPVPHLHKKPNAQ